MMIAAGTNGETEWHWGSAQLLTMLEKSFPPDQGHRLLSIEKELNYQFINSAAVRLFVGYKILTWTTSGVDEPELKSWCVENRQPGVLIVFSDKRWHEVSIEFKEYTGTFARSMMNKLSVLKEAYNLSIVEIPDHEDALVLYRLLAETFISKKL
jgi:hypothetical protein